MIHRILCPIDFSEPSLAAFRYAEQLAIQLNASLVVVHAFDRPKSLEPASQTVPADSSVQTRLEEFASVLPIERYLHAGPAGQVICWMAQEHGCDLIVMGTHGRTGLRHVLRGSVAEYALQHARCPVMTIRQAGKVEQVLEEPLVVPLPAPRMM